MGYTAAQCSAWVRNVAVHRSASAWSTSFSSSVPPSRAGGSSGLSISTRQRRGATGKTLDGISGVLLVHTLTMYPYFYLTVAAALEQSDDSLEEAAYGLGASRFQTWSRVLLPMLTPAGRSSNEGLESFSSSDRSRNCAGAK